MMTKESADGPDVIQGDDFSWTPAAWQGGMAYVDLMRTEGDASGSVGRIWCARAGGAARSAGWYTPGTGRSPCGPRKAAPTRLSVVGRGLGIPGGRDVSDGGVRVSDAGDAQPVSPVGGAAAIPG